MIDEDPAGWITPSRLDRLGQGLRVVGAVRPPGLRVEVAEVAIWKSVGGPRTDVPQLLRLLEVAGVLVVQQDHYRLTKPGKRVATQDHRYGGTLLVRSLVACGVFHRQARRLLESSDLDEATGEIHCPRFRALEVAPQLAGVLRRFPEVEFKGTLRLPKHLVEALDDAWISAQPVTRRDRRKQLGNRGEEFSYRLLRESARDLTQVRWVAQEDDGLGYDIEDRNDEPMRRIEVKCSSNGDVRFFLSANEWDQAQVDPEYYEIHFWAGVNLDAPPVEEFKRLRAGGYPLVYVNPAQLVEGGRLTARPDTYVVTLPPLANDEDGASAPPAGVQAAEAGP